MYDNFCEGFYEGLGRSYWPENVEVVGNIYDNPEILGDEEND